MLVARHEAQEPSPKRLPELLMAVLPVELAECSTGRRRKHTAQSVGEGLHGEMSGDGDGRVVD